MKAKSQKETKRPIQVTLSVDDVDKMPVEQLL
jgi:hypothetical protein